MTERPWYTERGVIASAAFLAVILVVGGVAVFSSGSGGDGQATSDAPTREGSSTSAAGPARHVDTGGSICGLPVGNTDKPVGPPDATWKLVGKIAAPSSPDYGPGLVTATERRCFAHSPIGAVFAAANWLATAGLHGGNADVMRNITARNRVREVYLRQPAAPVNPAFRLQIAGFDTTIASRDRVIVDLGVRTNYQGRYAVAALNMRWEYGDWRAELGSVKEPVAIAVVSDLSGYIPWSGA